MMGLKAIRLLILLLPMIVASKLAQHKAKTVKASPSYHFDYEEYYRQQVERHESGPASTKSPKHHRRQRSIQGKSIEQDAEEILAESSIIESNLVDDNFERFEILQDQSLPDLFEETFPSKKIDLAQCEAEYRKNELRTHFSYKEHHVYLSALDTDHGLDNMKHKVFTWQEAQKLCRSNCKELITLDTLDKAAFVYSFIKSASLLGVWTSGRRCDFPGCQDRDDILENGWFWTTTGQEIPTKRTPDQLPYKWAKIGHKRSQPDNAEFAIRGVNESCLALRYENDVNGLRLHDLPCHDKLNVLCEEPFEMSELRRIESLMN